MITTIAFYAYDLIIACYISTLRTHSDFIPLFRLSHRISLFLGLILHSTLDKGWFCFVLFLRATVLNAETHIGQSPEKK